MIFLIYGRNWDNIEVKFKNGLIYQELNKFVYHVAYTNHIQFIDSRAIVLLIYWHNCEIITG